MDRSASLEIEIKRIIAQMGPIPLSQFMSLCLTHPVHGYYMTRDPLGANGDFTTAPEVSQMFGELLGIWAISVWRLMGSPEAVQLVELGPGRGTLMRDALRAMRVVPEFRAAASVHLVEISPPLRKTQEQTLAGAEMKIHWHTTLRDVPKGPLIILANEFLDALPVQQVLRLATGWHERMVGLDRAGNFVFGIGPDPLPNLDRILPQRVRGAGIGAVYEWRPDRTMLEIGHRVAQAGGAALLIDYGHVESDVGDTLQAVRGHAYADPLAAPGLADLTAHVDFQAAAKAAENMGARVSGPIEQGEFLRNLGIESRADALRRAASPQQSADIDAAFRRLTGSGTIAMGELFKAMAVGQADLGVLPGFEG